MKLIPSSLARPRIALASSCENALPHSPPNCHVPTPTTETLRPVLPSLRYFMFLCCSCDRRDLSPHSHRPQAAPAFLHVPPPARMADHYPIEKPRDLSRGFN